MLAGHSMGAHTAVAYALAHPGAAQRPGRDRAGLRRLRSPTESLAYWDGLADGAGGGRGRRLRRLHRPRAGRSTPPGATRSCASPASGCCSTATSRRWSTALREVPRSRPFESLAELEGLEVPALVVASDDDADPGHPYAPSPRPTRGGCRGRALVSEAEGAVAARLAGRAGSRGRSPPSPPPIGRKRKNEPE